MPMIEGEEKYVAGLLAVGLALGIGAYVFAEGFYSIVVLVCLLAAIVEVLRVVIFGKNPQKAPRAVGPVKRCVLELPMSSYTAQHWHAPNNSFKPSSHRYGAYRIVGSDGPT